MATTLERSEKERGITNLYHLLKTWRKSVQ